MTKKKKFDCVAMKLAIQSEIYDETKKMNPAQLLGVSQPVKPWRRGHSQKK